MTASVKSPIWALAIVSAVLHGQTRCHFPSGRRFTIVRPLVSQAYRGAIDPLFLFDIAKAS